jgi:N-acetyl-alpha-D-muramate 1-phosphate uridylyltransferase
MKAMLLAAGRGLRMGDLTAHTAKPLLQVGGKPLIQWHIEKLVAAGFNELVINHAWCGDQIEARLKNGSQFGAQIQYSAENTALETAGGIANARHLLNCEVFPVISADIVCSFDYNRLHAMIALVKNLHAVKGIDGWCVMVPNPEFNVAGDFGFSNGALAEKSTVAFDANVTFGNIAVYHENLFRHIGTNQFAKLGDSLRHAVPQGRILGEMFYGDWFNVGTAQQLRQVDAALSA